MRCRACGSDHVRTVLDFGQQYVSDFVPFDKVNSGQQYRIALALCDVCTLVQQVETAPQDFLYSRHYWYKSGTTHTMRNALAEVANDAMSRVNLETGDTVLDIGSNDGTLLRAYPKHLYTVGFEPATNLAKEGAEGVSQFVNDFWQAGSAATLRARARIITACGMFYDLENPHEFISEVAEALHPEGLFIAQLMCWKQTVAKKDIGNLCHEHLEFYTLKSLQKLLARSGLHIVDIAENSINGGSYRLYIQHDHMPVNRNVYDAFEAEAGLVDNNTFKNLYNSMLTNKHETVGIIRGLVAAEKRVYVYGASTKGNALLQWYGLDWRLIAGAADKSATKHGLYTVGTSIRIYDEATARKNADVFLILPYAFVNEFVIREAKWRKNGGLFVVPLPEVHFV